MAESYLSVAFITFFLFTSFVAFYTWYRLRNSKLNSSSGYFLGGRSLTGIVIAGSMLLTNISTEHLIGMNGSSYVNGFVIISWEVTSALALVLAAIFFVPMYLRMGLTTIPEFLEKRFDSTTRSIVSLLLILSFVVTLLPIVLYTGAIGIERLFEISELFDVGKQEGLWMTVIIIGVIGSLYAIFGGLKAVALSDTINGYGLFIGGLLIPILALISIGDGNLLFGLKKVYDFAPEKFNVVGDANSVMPFEVLFTGLIINQIYFWAMNQTIIQRALGAKNLKEAQKGLLLTGVYKILIPIVIILPGVICYYYFQEAYYDPSLQDTVYPRLVKKILPSWLVGFFAAVTIGAVLSTFNSVLNSAATLFSLDIYKKHLGKNASQKKLVSVGKLTSSLLAILAIIVAPFIAKAPEGLFQLLQQLNGIFFIPIGSILIAGFFFKYVSELAAKVALFFGFFFYIFMSWIFVDHGIHFIHVWGIEFVLNVIIMYVVSYFYPRKNSFTITNTQKIEMKPWSLTKIISIVLVILTISIYIFLSDF